MYMVKNFFSSLKSVVQLILYFKLTWLYVFSAFLSMGSSYCLSWEKSLLLNSNNFAEYLYQGALQVELLNSGAQLLSEFPHAQDNPECRISVLPNDTQDLIEKNNRLTGCTLVLSGVYTINYPIYIKNKLVDSEFGQPDFLGRESVKTYVQPALETSGPGVITELVIEPAGGDSFHKTTVLALKEEAKLLMLDEGRIQGVAVLPPDSFQNSDCSFLNAIYYLKPQGAGSDMVFWPHILPGGSDIYCLQEYSKEVGGDKHKYRRAMKQQKQAEAEAEEKEKAKAEALMNRIRANYSCMRESRRRGALAAAGAGGGDDDKDKDRGKKVTFHDLATLLEKIVNAKREEEDISKLEAELKDLYWRATEGVQNSFKEKHKGTLDHHNISTPW